MNILTISLVVIISGLSPSFGVVNVEDINDLSENNEKTCLTILATKNSSGGWSTSFTAEKKVESSTKRVQFDIIQNIVNHGGKQYLQINGVLTGVNAEESGESLIDIRFGNTEHSPNTEYFQRSPCDERSYFECKCEQGKGLRFDSEMIGKKAVLIKKGRAAYRKSPKDDDGAFGNLVTSRPLNDDELFEIQIEETIDSYKDRGLAMGVVAFPPSTIGNESYILWKKRAWGLWRNNLHLGSTVVKEDYALDLRNLVEGTRVGVMRKRTGDLHFFKNGHDMGAAAQNVPTNVYGFVDLINDVSMITIVN